MALSFATTVTVFAIIPSPNGVIYGCYMKSTPAPFLPATMCSSSRSVVSAACLIVAWYGAIDVDRPLRPGRDGVVDAESGLAGRLIRSWL